MSSLLESLLVNYGPEQTGVVNSAADGGDAEELNKRIVLRALATYKQTQVDGNPAEIFGTQGTLFIGSIGAALNLQSLLSCQITHILCLCGSSQLRYPNEFVYRRVVLDDSGSNDALKTFKDCLPSCLQFIEDAIAASPQHRVLVHCSQGKSRSAAICVAFLMSREHITFDEGLARVRLTRPVSEPNFTFQKYLQEEFEKSSSVT